MVARLGSGAGRIGENNKGGRLGSLLGKGVVEDEAVHATTSGADVIRADGDFVSLTFADPFYR